MTFGEEVLLLAELVRLLNRGIAMLDLGGEVLLSANFVALEAAILDLQGLIDQRFSKRAQ